MVNASIEGSYKNDILSATVAETLYKIKGKLTVERNVLIQIKAYSIGKLS